MVVLVDEDGERRYKWGSGGSVYIPSLGDCSDLREALLGDGITRPGICRLERCPIPQDERVQGKTVW
jgi:hypothetical protein